MSTQQFRANGKLLLSAEYVVLDGAVALAVPTKYGQSMTVEEGTGEHLTWESYDCEGQCWFKGDFSLPNGEYINGNDDGVGKTLEKMFWYITSIHTYFLEDKQGTTIKTHLDFPRDWGLGSSSTMIYNLAQWAKVDAFLLLENSMGGSGYDIACAGADASILYQLQFKNPISQKAGFSPTFKNQLYFVYLGNKQNSRSGIQYYREQVKESPEAISHFTIMTNRMKNATTIEEFQSLMKQHEKTMSKLLGMKRVKKARFTDFWGEVKSLGAWGGDFVMVASQKSADETRQYFADKGHDVFFSYDEMIL